YPNRWCRIRECIREPAAEALGTLVLVLIGLGVNCQVALSANTAIVPAPMGIFLSNAFGWALGAACGVWISAGISGGHINPGGQVTIAMAVYRGFPWRKVPLYILGQVLGSFVAALVVYGNYFHAIDIIEGGRSVRTVPGTASYFTSYAADYASDLNCFFTEFLCSFVLLLVVFAITDAHNAALPPHLAPLALFAALFCIISGLGLNTSFAINPARDFGPRLMTSIVGYGESVWAYRHQFWLWCTVCGPLAGGLVAGGLYDALLYTGADSVFNR
ncbi:aquaporin-like protein, partial [Vararia minispora EC-137]